MNANSERLGLTEVSRAVARWNTYEYLEGLRISVVRHETLGEALDRAQRSARLGIDVDVYEYHVTGERLQYLVPNTARVVATVSAYAFGPVYVTA
jgi:hypothetical protein